MTSVTSPDERVPQQARSRASWDRVLQVGMKLFAERGWQGLTITEVCRRAQVTAPSIYARVDGKAALFRAVHERWLMQIEETDRSLRDQHLRAGMSAPEAGEASARVIIGVFDAHQAALRALIDRSASDAELLERGNRASTQMLTALAQSIPAPPADADAAVRAVYAECLMRTMYGPAFLRTEPEDDAAFLTRVSRMAMQLAEQ